MAASVAESVIVSARQVIASVTSTSDSTTGSRNGSRAAADAFAVASGGENLGAVLTLLDGTGPESDVDSVCRAVEQCVPLLGPSSEWCQGLVPLISAAMLATSARVRAMACRVVGYLLEDEKNEETSMVSKLWTHKALESIVSALGDADEEVAMAARHACITIGSSSPGLQCLFGEGQGCLELLLEFSGSQSATIRLRSLDAAMGIAAQSRAAADGVASSGILNRLLLEIGNTSDLLACLNALEVASTLLGNDRHGTLLNPIVRALWQLAKDGGVDEMLVAGAIRGLGHALVGQQTVDERNDILSFFVHKLGEGRQLAEAAAGALGDMGTDDLTLIAEQAILTEALVESLTSAAFGSSNRLAEMHALSSLVGAERRGRALLGDEAEARLRQGIEASMPSTLSISDVLLKFISGGDSVKRIAIYRLIAPMATRRWFTINLCHNPELIDRLTDTSSEREQIVTQFRHAAVLSLKFSAEAAFMETHAATEDNGTRNSSTESILEQSLRKLARAEAVGAYGAGNTVQAVPVIATERR